MSDAPLSRPACAPAAHMDGRRWGRTALPFALLAAIVAAGGVASLALGAVKVPPGDVVAALTGTTDDAVTRAIVVELRLPRAVLAVLVGAGLGAAGAAYQALFRNPLADPFVVGASSGAAAGAALVIVTGWAGATAGLGPASVGAFVGAVGSVWLVYAVAAVGRLPPVTLLLAGATVSTMLGALVWLMMALADENVPKIVGWLMGGLAGRGWEAIAATWPPLAAGTLLLVAMGRPLDAVCCGEDEARSLGLRVELVMGLVLAGASLAVAAAVAAGGVIGFVGLAAPHVARPMVGAAHARLVPASGLVGAALLLGADVLARTAAAPIELPIGVVTALLGGPLFLAVLRRGAGRAAGGR